MRQFEVRVKTGSSLGPMVEAEVNGDMTVHLRQPAIDNLANRELIELIAKHHDISKSRVTIVRGNATRLKVIRIND